MGIRTLLDCFIPFLGLLIELNVDYLFHHAGKVGGVPKFVDIELEQPRQNFDAKGSVCRLVAAFIDIALDYSNRHPAVGQYEVDPALLRILLRMASGSSRFSLALVLVVHYVCPYLVFYEGQGGGERVQGAIEVSHYKCWSRFHCFELDFDDGKDVVSPCRKLAPFFAPVQP